jgi:hypothetical protein
MHNDIIRFKDIFYQLVATNLCIAREHIFSQIINLYIWTSCTLIIMGYIMQNFGLATNYGCFQFASIVGVVGLFEVYNAAARTIMDIDNDRTISYYLTLPARPTIVFAATVCSYAIIGLLLTMAVLPLGKLLFYNSFNFAQVSWIKFVITAVLANIFFGIFMIVVVAQVGTISKMRNVWSRFIWPLWVLGCYQFSWKAVYAVSAPFAYFLLCNPVLYVMEGMRGALLTHFDSLPWGLCIAGLCFFIMVGWQYAYYKMQRLLDFV